MYAGCSFEESLNGLQQAKALTAKCRLPTFTDANLFHFRPVFLVSVFAVALAAIGHYLSWAWLLAPSLPFSIMVAGGTVNIRWNIFLRSLNHGARHTRTIALSFDDGPAGHTAAILAILKKEGVPAAFFTIGRRADESPDAVARWDAEGHIIGGHSYLHGFNFDWQGAKKMQAEIEQTAASVQRITGKKPVLFRPPYGVTNPALARAVRRSHVTSIGWSLRSFDTQAKSGEALLSRLSKQIKGGDIILLHDTQLITANILTALIRDCRAKGFTFVRLDQMLGIDAYA